jgi:hypothetical protein
VVLPFDASIIYGTPPLLAHLDTPFFEIEIHDAVMQLAHNKALGLDNIPSETIQKYWITMKLDVLNLIVRYS